MLLVALGLIQTNEGGISHRPFAILDGMHHTGYTHTCVKESNQAAFILSILQLPNVKLFKWNQYPLCVLCGGVVKVCHVGRGRLEASGRAVTAALVIGACLPALHAQLLKQIPMVRHTKHSSSWPMCSNIVREPMSTMLEDSRASNLTSAGLLCTSL